MDKLAKRAAVAVAVLIAVGVIGLGVGLTLIGAKLEQDTSKSKAADSRKLSAALTLPAAEPVAAPAPPPIPAPAVVEAAKQDLASAFGAALGVEVKKNQPASASGSPSPASNAGPTTKPVTASSDMLDLGASASSRGAKLGNRDAKSLDVRQTGGEKAQLKKERDPSERLSFETDLGSAR